MADKDKDVRALGFEQVRTGAKGEQATKLFAAQLSKMPPDAQAGLLSALAERGDSAARSAVLDLLARAATSLVRVAAISALVRSVNPPTLRGWWRFLAKALSSKRTPPARASSASKANPRSSKSQAQMKKADPPLRVALIEVLTARRGLSAIPDLCTAAIDADPRVCTAAMAALGQLAGPDQLPAMVKGVLAANKGAERDAAEKAVALVCSRITDPAKRADALLAAMNPIEIHAERRRRRLRLAAWAGLRRWK